MTTAGRSASATSARIPATLRWLAPEQHVVGPLQPGRRGAELAHGVAARPARPAAAASRTATGGHPDRPQQHAHGDPGPGRRRPSCASAGRGRPPGARRRAPCGRARRRRRPRSGRRWWSRCAPPRRAAPTARPARPAAPGVQRLGGRRLMLVTHRTLPPQPAADGGRRDRTAARAPGGATVDDVRAPGPSTRDASWLGPRHERSAPCSATLRDESRRRARPGGDAEPDIHTTAGKLADLDRRVDDAVHAGSEAAVERQHAKGRQTARERVEQLLDPGSFVELDALVRHRSTNFGMEAQAPVRGRRGHRDRHRSTAARSRCSARTPPCSAARSARCTARRSSR